jgi:hypothetical protein
MSEPFQEIVRYLIGDRLGPGKLAIELDRWLAAGGPAALSAAFLVVLAGRDHPLAGRARAILEDGPDDTPAELVALLRAGVDQVHEEIAEHATADPAFARRLTAAASVLAGPEPDPLAATEAAWSVLYPEAVGLQANVERSVAALRRRRIVEIDELNPQPIVDAAREVLFTSNVLLGLPLESPDGRDPELDPLVEAAVARARVAGQSYWFDHPVPIGVAPAANELLHGLRGLDAAMRAEPARPDGRPRRLTCLLSVSVTHADLRGIAQRYIEEMAGVPALEQVDVLVATETDVRRLVAEVLEPALARFGPSAPDQDRDRFDVLGVDGEYGRHYSFLKAIAAIWQVLVDPAVRGTFKIDLDQVFPQPELVAETGRMALEHLQTPLWGATGRDSSGRPVELGLLAGALVNASDIGRGLFTPDVPLPAGPGRPSQHVFFSPLPQAISTRAEMLERYDTPSPDGVASALERIHVTGGTSGILVDALRRHRPFTPSFIGRAEDQAYALSVQGQPGPRLACVHAAGLVMRHDKEAYAGAAIEAAEVGKMVGDDIRILVFSAYARALADGSVAAGSAAGGTTVAALKALMDPFTGGFISELPITTVLLRFALRIVEAYAAGQPERGRDYATLGSGRLGETLRSIADRAGFRASIEGERRQWNALYETIDGLEVALHAGDPGALALRDRARELIDGWRLAKPPSAGAG